jgi:hypothetical protein
MTYYADIAPCTLFGYYPSVVAVGWLEPEHPYNKGEVDASVVSTLAELLVDPWAPAALGGGHRCSFCGGRESHSFKHHDRTIALGANNVFVPGAVSVYLAPSLILHYITDHQYKPPAMFVEAVLACPPMRSPEYFSMLQAHGVVDLV